MSNLVQHLEEQLVQIGAASRRCGWDGRQLMQLCSQLKIKIMR